MGSAINALIAQGGEPLPDFNEQRLRRVQLRNQQLASQELAAQRAEAVKKAQRAARDEQIVRSAFMQAGGDPQKFRKIAIPAGVSPEGLFETEKGMANAMEAWAKADKAEQDAALAKAGLIQNQAQALRNMKDPAGRQVAYSTVRESFGPNAPEQYDENYIQFQASSANFLNYIDAETKQAQEARAAEEEKRKVALYAPALAKAEADATRAQQVAAGTEPITPYQQAQLGKPTGELAEFRESYYPGWLEQKGVPASAANEMQALMEFKDAKRERVPVPGVDVVLPPEVEAQRRRIAAANAAASAAARGTSGGGASDDPKIIADAIIKGIQPPTTQGLYGKTAAVRAELARRGYDFTTAQRDYDVTKRHLATLNGPQQERLRQAITFTSDSLENIEALYREWQQAAPVAGIKVLNRAALGVLKQFGGKAGEIATNLEAQINDLTSELGTVYKGGNSSTDESLRLAAANLKADWNPQTFDRAVKQIRQNLAIRRNSILTSQPVGVSPDSPYNPMRQTETTIPTVNSKADYDKLPSGAVFMEDGRKYRKP